MLVKNRISHWVACTLGLKFSLTPDTEEKEKKKKVGEVYPFLNLRENFIACIQEFY